MDSASDLRCAHTKHCGDHIVTTLIQSQLGGIHRRALNAGMSTIHEKTALVFSRPTYSRSWERSTNPPQCRATLKDDKN